MSKHAFARSFKDLIVYQRARTASQAIFQLTQAFPREETYSLIDQVRRSSRSIGAQISEAWAKRRYPNHFISKLTDADGEQNETQHWLTNSYDCEYISSETLTDICGIMDEIGRMLQRMIDRAEDFAGHPADRVKEAHPFYGALDEFFSDTEH